MAGTATLNRSSQGRLVHLDIKRFSCHNVFIAGDDYRRQSCHPACENPERRALVLLKLRFAKTSLEDVAKRANLSRTLLYRTFKDKDDIYRAVFVDWLVSRYPAAKLAANGPGSPYERLFSVCQLMALEPWTEMVGTPMGSEFLATCALIDPESEALYRKVAHECVATILGDEANAEVFLLALDGLFADQPSAEVLEQRTKRLAAHFAPLSAKQETRKKGTQL